MIVNLGGVENKEPRVYIRKEGHYTLKCEEVRFLKNSTNGNPIFRFLFKNKHGEYLIEDITITENTKWKIKQLADAFGFTYDRVNIFHFVGMYCVGWIVSRKVKNSADQIVDVFECKQYAKSAKPEFANTIPPEGSVPLVHEQHQARANEHDGRGTYIPQVDIEIDEDEIPF